MTYRNLHEYRLIEVLEIVEPLQKQYLQNVEKNLLFETFRDQYKCLQICFSDILLQ
jgi:hypothetical protein